MGCIETPFFYDFFTFAFRRLANLPSEGSAPHTLLVFAALLPWNLFSNAVQTVWWLILE